MTNFGMFKKLARSIILPFYKDLEPVLRKARINKSLSEYAENVAMYAFLIMIALFILGFAIAMMAAFFLKIPKLIIAGPIVGFVLALVGFTSTIILFKMYPSMVASTRARKIDNALYMVALYMSTIAESGAHPISMFSLLAKYKEFGELSKEAEDIVYLVKNLGIDFPKALEIKAKYSPSAEWKELLEGIKSTIVEGGNLSEYLYGKTRLYIQDYKRKLLEYISVLQVFLELYITLVIVGVVFVIVITMLMGSVMGGSTTFIKQIQLIIVCVVLPVVSIMFMLMMKAISPFEY